MPRVAALLIACLPVAQGLGINWYQSLTCSQTTFPWQPLWKALTEEQENDIVSWNGSGFPVYKFQHRSIIRWMQAVRLLNPFPVRQASRCISSQRGLFDIQHCAAVIARGLQEKMKACIVFCNSAEEQNHMKSSQTFPHLHFELHYWK